MAFRLTALLLGALMTFMACSDGSNDSPSQPSEEAPQLASEDLGESGQEAGTCPARLQCPNYYYQFMNVCGSTGKTSSFNCYTAGSAIPIQIKPTKGCEYCYPYDGSIPWCGSISGLMSLPPWAKCYSSPK